MGRLVETLAGSHGSEIVGIVDPVSPSHTGGLDAERHRLAEVAIDFTTAEAFGENFPQLAARGLNVVVGTTGWGPKEEGLRKQAADAGIGVVAAPNFSIGVLLFDALVAEAARRFQAQPDFGAWVHEIHHAAKKDAPSGTALALKATMEKAGFARPIDLAANRAGFVPGTHTVGFDGPFETVTLVHAARDRAAFAHGALVAARWVRSRRGWFTMRDVLGLGA
jgi:4-hydroxy-tetrahydrodipicolinate reductase